MLPGGESRPLKPLLSATWNVEINAAFDLFPNPFQPVRRLTGIPGATGRGEPRMRHARWLGVGSDVLLNLGEFRDERLSVHQS